MLINVYLPPIYERPQSGRCGPPRCSKCHGEEPGFLALACSMQHLCAPVGQSTARHRSNRSQEITAAACQRAISKGAEIRVGGTLFTHVHALLLADGLNRNANNENRYPHGAHGLLLTTAAAVSRISAGLPIPNGCALLVNTAGITSPSVHGYRYKRNR